MNHSIQIFIYGYAFQIKRAIIKQVEGYIDWCKTIRLLVPHKE